MNLIIYLWNKIYISYIRLFAKFKSASMYPDAISINLNDLISKQRLLKVAIIDDAPFPWVEALEKRGCKVSIYTDYIKANKNPTKSACSINFEKYDIILCDIHGVGTTVYPGFEGLGAIQELRQRYPLHVIAAYTGDVGSIYSKLKRQTFLDMVFAREWELDDFLLNFEELTKIFYYPKQRWHFLRKRLEHIGIEQSKCEKIRKIFVENVIIAKHLGNRSGNIKEEAKKMILLADKTIDMSYLFKYGITAYKIGSLISPFLLEDKK